MRLGTLLLRDAVITLGQLEAALRAQILGGGRLGTNLVELGHLDVDTLGRYLGRVQGVEVADAAELEAADPDAIALVGPERAGRFTAFPLGFVDGRLQVVFRDPADAHAVAQLERELDVRIEPRCAAELRLFYYLERHYGIRRPRFLRSSDAAEPPSGRERRRTQPPPSATPIIVHFERQPDPSAPTAAPAAPRVSAEETAARIAAAGNRDAIGDALLDFCVGRFGAAALFIVRGRRAIGWKARGGRTDDLQNLSLALAGVSALQTALDGEKPYRGAAPTPGRPIERQLWSALGVFGQPKELIVVPIAVRGRVINLLYAHGLAGAPLAEEAVTELEALCATTGEAYLRLIQAAKAAP